MAHTLEDFVGIYHIRHGEGSFELIHSGYKLCIGTGTCGDPKPDGIRIGLAIFNPNPENPGPVLPAAGNPPAFAYLVDGTLNGSGYWINDLGLPELLTYQVSLMTLRKPDGGIYKAVSIIITIGDPDNAGVWGADDESSG